MKKAPLIIGALALTLLVGHYMLWQQQVEALTNAVEAAAKQGAPNETVTFTYASKKTGGYPLNAQVRYTNPAITITTKSPEPGETAAQPQPFEVTSARLDGTLSIAHGIITPTGTLQTNGVFHLNGKREGKAFAYASSSSETAICNMTAAESALTFAKGKTALNTAKSPRDYLRAISSLDCTAKGITIKDELLNTSIASIADQHISLHSKPSATAGHYNINMQLSVRDMLLTSNNSDALLKLGAIFGGSDPESVASLTKMAQKHPIPWFDASRAGKQSIAFNGSYEGSLDQFAPPFHVDVKELALKNDFYTLSWPFSVSISATKDMQIHHKGSVTLTAASDQNVKESIDALLAILKDSELAVSEDTRVRLNRLDAASVQGLVPPLSPLGQINTLANLQVGSNTGDVVIDALGLTTNVFGLTFKGSGNLKQGNADATIICQSCNELVTRLSHYVNDIVTVFSALEGTPPRFVFTQDGANAVASLLHEHDTDQDPGTVTITVKKDKGGNMTISGKDAGMVMMQGAMKLAPHFPSLAPH